MDELTRTLDIGELMVRERVLDQSARDQGPSSHYGLILVSIEGLKVINSEHAPETGDEVLKQLAQRLCKAFPDNPVARVDSDKFAVLIDDIEQAELSRAANQAKLDLPASPWIVEGRKVAVSVGVVAVSGPVTSRFESHLVWASIRAHRTAKLQGLKRRLADVEAQLRMERLQSEVGALRADLAMAIYHRDPLTGLLNGFGLADVRSSLEVPYALAFIDLDNLREMNKTPDLRWEAGNRALVAVARVLESISPEATAIRWGGDEFLVLLPRVTAQTAHDVIETHIRHSNERLRVGSIPITLSGGIASVLDADGYQSAMDEAEELATQAKLDGRSRILIAQPEKMTT
jgi:diguanylate cyclase (GGDEF)-like protein